MISRTSADWPPLKRWLEKRIAKLFDELAAPTCGVKEGEHIRGKIMFAREIISTVEPSAPETATSVTVPGAGY